MLAREWQGVGELNRAHRIFRVVKILCIILQWYIYVIIHISKPIECTISRVNSKVTSRLWLIMICQCKLILGKKCTILMSFSPSCLIASSCLMHVKLSIQPEIQGKPDIDFWATSLYNSLCSKSLSCKVQPVSQSSSLIFVSSAHSRPLLCVWPSPLHIWWTPWPKAYTTMEFTSCVSLHSRITSLGCLLSTFWKKILHIL